MSIRLPIQYDAELNLQDLDKQNSTKEEWRHMKIEGLKRGLQIPPVPFTGINTKTTSGNILLNMSGVNNQGDLLPESAKNLFETETKGQAYKKLWEEVIGRTPSTRDKLEYEFSDVQIDPRLVSAIVDDNQLNMYSKKPEQYGDKVARAFQNYSSAYSRNTSGYGYSRPGSVESRLSNEVIRTAIVAGKAGIPQLQSILERLKNSDGKFSPMVGFLQSAISILDTSLEVGQASQSLLRRLMQLDYGAAQTSSAGGFFYS